MPMPKYLSDDELSEPADLPDLDVLFPPKPLLATGTNTGLRRSPRKKAACREMSPQKREASETKSPSKQSRYTAARKPSKTNTVVNDHLANIPLLPRNATTTDIQVTSNNRRSPFSPQRTLRLAHVDSALLPLKYMASEGGGLGAGMSSQVKQDPPRKTRRSSEESVMTGPSQRPSRSEQRQAAHYTSRFVLKEARCNDDEENSNDEEDDEDTDLSGFIVDDDAELSIYNTSALESEDDSDDERKPSKRVQQVAPRRRLVRGSPTRRRLDFGEDDELDKENHATDVLSKAMRNVSLGDKHPSMEERDIEVIDLTSSPLSSPKFKSRVRPGSSSARTHNHDRENATFLNSNPFMNFDEALKFTPPSSKPTIMIPSKEQSGEQAITSEDEHGEEKGADVRFTTPPVTPPRSPSKLKSPSKLLSPSKRQAIPDSPHRQSMDAFWDHNVINDWNDEFSPKKAPAPSPAKRGLARFQIWDDSDEEEEDDTLRTSDSLPSPCLSPQKGKSTIKSPEKEEKKRLAMEKRAATTLKKAFDSRKGQLALDLLRELDEKVADGQLQKLSSSTGGVKITWSKTLRSTAGRANWKRTVTKLSGSPIKGNNPDTSDPGVKVQHFASIELAEKIIDCEDRLVNTLAHEFCHLTNFMISNVRDQPHGASFKKWAQKVTKHLRSATVDSWRQVEVTTKHNYAINHKYLWVCIGRPRTLAMDFLNVAEDEGCGAEYGRHSKSIDTEKHRCGKCKGLLVQVRPKPRANASPKKKTGENRMKREGSAESSGSGTSLSSSSSSISGGSQSSVFKGMIETIELSD